MSGVSGQQLPQGWITAELADVAQIVMGQSPPSVTYNKMRQGVPFFQGKAEFGILYPDIRVWCRRPCKIAEADDVLLSVRAPVGPTNLAPAQCCIGRGLAAVRPEAGLSLKYLLYTFRRFAEELGAKGAGTTFKAVSGKVVREFPVPIAPPAEQCRIADALDELFSDLDAGVAALERVRNKLKLYRAAVLKAAVETWASQRPREAPLRQLAELIGEIDQGWSPRCDLTRAPDPEEWAIIKTTAVQSMRYHAHESKPLPSHLKPRTAIEIKPGDILMTRKGPRQRTGVTCLVRKTGPHLMLCDTVYRFRCNESVVLPEYLELALNSPSIVNEIDKRKSGTSDSGISLNHKQLYSLPLPVPRRKQDQEAIVEVVEDQVSVIERLEAELEAKLKGTHRLRQAILRQAFTGRLVPQDSNDEPVSELLKRIGAERLRRAHEAVGSKPSNGSPLSRARKIPRSKNPEHETGDGHIADR
jgi:type I restriction enzyme, S subunit